LLLEFHERRPAAELFDEVEDALRPSGAREHGIDGDAASRAVLREAARNRQLCGLGHSVVDHLHRDLDPTLAADEDHASPATLLHSADVGAAEPDAAQDIHLEEAKPVLVRDLFERLGLEDAKVIDEDVDRGETGGEIGNSVGFGEVADEGLEFGLWI